jgi:pimeloyl-ACP methyl ester carboxylesterase
MSQPTKEPSDPLGRAPYPVLSAIDAPPREEFLLPSKRQKMAAIIGVGGLLSVKSHSPLYRPILGGTSGDLSADERFHPIPERGLGNIDEMYGALEEDVLRTYQRMEGQKSVLVGHSLGGLMVSMLAMNHPDKFAAAICIAGAQSGVRSFSPGARTLKKALGNPSEAEKLLVESDFMRNHQTAMATHWPAAVQLHLISPTVDELIPPAQALAAQIPEGQRAHRNFVAPPMTQRMRRMLGMPDDARHLRGAPTEHISIALSIATLRYVRGVREHALPRPHFEIIQGGRQSSQADRPQNAA